MRLGHGAHYCLGGLLAKLELQTVIGMLAERVRTIEVPDETLELRKEPRFRGLVRLNLAMRT